jgi:putative flavoprotein involved in K+ transport
MIPSDSPSSTPADKVRHWLAAFERALSAHDVEACASLFHPHGFWRDLLAFSWNIVTAEGRGAIVSMLRQTAGHAQATQWTMDGAATETQGTTEAWFHFDTTAGRGRGILRLREGRAWTLFTTLQELRGFEEPAGDRRPRGVVHAALRGRSTWAEERAAEAAALGITTQPYCLVVGGGQGGIGLAARLKRLGVPTLVIDRLERPGDSWRRRYKTLCLHDPVWYDHLPYLPFPDHWPVFTPKDKMGDWLEMYVRVMELAYWSQTECLGASHDPDADAGAGRWTVQVRHQGVLRTLRPTQLVLATGMSGLPQTPRFAGAEDFQGVQVHSSAFTDGESWRGKRCVVIGSNNSAHDICVNLWENEADVTMVQRSPTMVARSETLQELGWGRLFSEQALRNGFTTERADLMLASTPYRLVTEAQKLVWQTAAERDAGFYAQLRQAGFQLHFGEDGSGLTLLYLRRGSGYYIDVGGSALIINGQVGLCSGVQVARLTAQAVVLSDGRELPADLVVYATGYGSMEGWAARCLSPEIAARVGKVWGLGSDTVQDPGPWQGELRNMWKPTAQPGLWFHGGNLQQSRSYSLYLALQIKARMEGLATPVFGGTAH